MGTEIVAAETWLFDTLFNDPTLFVMVSGQVFATVAPLDAAYPFVVYQQQAANDMRGVGTARIGSDLLYLVKVIVDEPSYARIDAIAAQIDLLLHGAQSGAVFACTREQPFSLPESDSGVEYRHLGGIYRLLVQA